MNDREHTIGVLDRQAEQSGDQSERETLEKAAAILRKRNEALHRGPGPAGAPADEKVTR